MIFDQITPHLYLLNGFASVGDRQTDAPVVNEPHGAHFPLSPLHPPIAATAPDANMVADIADNYGRRIRHPV